MARGPDPNFFGAEMFVAAFVALAAQAVFIALLTAGESTPIKADISDQNSKPMAVAITPVVNDLPLLKLGGKPKPGVLPDMWKRKPPPTPVKTQQKEVENAVTPSTKASATLDAIPDAAVTEAGAAPTDALVVASADPSLSDAAPSDVDPNLSGPGTAAGSENGTEIDPLKGQAIDQYKAELSAWFNARCVFKGKLPFEVLKDLSARVVAHVSAGRTVESWSWVSKSGNDVFDAEVQRAMDGAQSSGAVLPPPPPQYPDILGKPFPLRFACSNEKFCK